MRIADIRASQLLEEIERVRLTFEPDRQASLTAIAEALNEAGVRMPSAKDRWQATTVKRVLTRAFRKRDPLRVDTHQG